MISVNKLSKVYSLNADFSDFFLKAVIKSAKLAFVKKERPRKVVLDNISFHVNPGEVVGILGKNGAGKSTLLKILSGITEPTSGEYSLSGRVASLLEVGTGFHPELTGRENIFLNAAILGMTRLEVEKKFNEIVDFSGVKEFLDTPVKRYSSGMYVRLAFAVAAHLEQEILIVDEVLAVGDYQFQRKCLSKMDSVANSGKTVLFVSHNFDAMRNLCKRGIVLSNGSISYDGDIENAITHYISANNMDDSPSLSRKFETGVLRSIDLDVENNEYPATGKPLVINLSINTIDLDIYARTNPVLILKIRDQLGSVVIGCRNDFQGCQIDKLSKGEHTVSVEIACMNLIPGNYTIDFEFWSPGDIVEERLGCLQFPVEWYDRPDEMLGWNVSYGNVYSHASWVTETSEI